MLRRIKTALATLWSSILEFMLPTSCAICGMVGEKHICQSCLSAVRFVDELGGERICVRCSSPYVERCFDCEELEMKFDRLFALFLYEGIGQRIIHELKFKGRFFLVRPFYQRMYEKLRDVKFDIIVPVPSEIERFVKRGYNTSYFIAATLGEIFGKRVLILLDKVEKRPSQLDLRRDERLRSPSGAFALMSENLRYVGEDARSVLLVDDVATTCSTLSECARVLKSRFDVVYAFALARAPSSYPPDF